MNDAGTIYGPYGTAFTIYFSMQDTADPDILYTGWTFAAGDVKVSKDGGAVANSANSPGTTGDPSYSLQLSATEMQATSIVVLVQDQGTEAFEPCRIEVRTVFAPGQITVDATQTTNGNAITASGNGSGHGLIATGGATGDGLKGVGGATSGYGLRATATDTEEYNNVWDVAEGAEPSGAIASEATQKQILQHMKRRFFNKVTATSTTLTQFKDDSSTSRETQTVSDDGTTQTVGKSS